MLSHQLLRTFSFCLPCAAAIVLWSGCQKAPKFSDTPNIQYKNLKKQTYFDADRTVFADSVTIGVHFEDGDGDIGYPQDERNETNIDFFVDVYRQTGGVFNPVTLPSGVTYNGHIPLLVPVSSAGPIEGDLFYSIIFPYATSQVADDTLKFVVRLEDRKGNSSNTVETDPVIIRKTP